MANLPTHDIGILTTDGINETAALQSDLALWETLSDCLEKKHVGFSSSTISWKALSIACKLIYQCNEIAVVFAINRASRAYALPERQNVYRDSEYCVTFRSYELALQRPHIVIAHEILHLFGAADLYTPQNVAALAKIYFPQSIMDDGETMDEITRYAIGWTDDLSENAVEFLAKTI